MQPAKKIKRDKTPEQAYAALIRLCARSEKSSGDALRLMQRWGVEPSARQGVLQKLLAGITPCFFVLLSDLPSRRPPDQSCAIRQYLL